LAEVAVELADGVKGVGRLEADKLVDFMAQILTGAGGGYGNRDHDTANGRAEGTSCRFHCRSGGEAIIDQKDGATDEREGRMAAAVGSFAAFDLEPFAGGNGGDGFLADSVSGHNVALDDDDSATGNSAHGQFLLTGDAKFAYDKDVERQAQFECDFKRDGNAAARQAEDDGTVGVQIAWRFVTDNVRQCATGLRTVLKNETHTQFFFMMIVRLGSLIRKSPPGTFTECLRILGMRSRIAPL
jgi:hypothetical protein